MVKEVSAVSFRQNLGEMLNLVQYRNESIVINKDGKPVAALVDAELFARIRRMRDRFDALSNRIAKAYREVPLEEGLAEIDTLVAKIRATLMARLRVVLDTNVLVSGWAYPESIPGNIVSIWCHGGIDGVLSRHILDKVAGVVPRLSRIQLSSSETQDLMDTLMFLAGVIEPDAAQEPTLRAPGDQQVLETLRNQAPST